MKDDEEETLTEEYEEEEYNNGFLRWMSIVVVMVAVAGFFALAYYAYHTGTESINEADITLVQADAAPMKETPADPGGLQVPHQDKTVYEVITAPEPGAKPTAERVLPQPEEPVKLRSEETTQTWISNSATATGSSAAPGHIVRDVQMVESKPIADAAPVKYPPGEAPATPVESKVITIDAKTGKAKESAPAQKPVTIIPVPVQEKTAVASATKQEAKPAIIPKAEKPEAMANAAPAAGDPSIGVQLGAFRSEEEANGTWLKIYKASGEVIGDRRHSIQRADLGSKGVYYRLQVSRFPDANAAKSLCGRLAARKQGCFLVKAN